VLDCCLGLIIIDDGTSTIRLVHKSLEQYINNKQEILFKHGHSDLARICLSYMSLNDPDPDLRVYPRPVQESKRMDQASDDRRHRIKRAFRYEYGIWEKYVFLDYSLKNWGHHMRKQPCTATEELAVSLFRDKTNPCRRTSCCLSDGFLWLPLEEATMMPPSYYNHKPLSGKLDLMNLFCSFRYRKNCVASWTIRTLK
jgi:hypothetical protein